MAHRGRPPLLSDDVILDRALSMFASYGYSAMSVRALNAALGLSHETVSKRFGSKSELFRLAVARGVTLLMADFHEEWERCASGDDLERLHATVRAFMVASSRHPALGDLLHNDNIDAERRMIIIGQSGLGQRISDTAALLGRLHTAGIVRETGVRELWFLTEGAVAPLRYPELSRMFDAIDGPVDGEKLIDRMSEAVVRSVMV